VDGGLESWLDGVQGPISVDVAATIGDYVIWRKDDLPAYHLAVVLDDAAQGVTAIVRGVDLLEATGVHLHLQRTLGFRAPLYFHTPVIVNRSGQKLSKQTGAADVAREPPPAMARRVLEYLGLPVPAELAGAAPADLWRYAIEHWRIDSLASVRQLSELPEPPQAL
jgi:glutamyl-Q tRNA(Asp) synthetase